MYTPVPPTQSGSLPVQNFNSSKWEYRPTDHKTCSHLWGSLGPSPSHLTDIVWHQLNNGIDFGICLNCQRQFWPADPDYVEWRKKPSAQKMSSAGKEEPMEPGEIPDYLPPPRTEMGGSLETDFDVLFPDDSRVLILVHGVEVKK